MIPTIFAGNTGRTQGDIDDKRKQLAYAMLEQGMDASPVQSPWEGSCGLPKAGSAAWRFVNSGRSSRQAPVKVPAFRQASLPHQRRPLPASCRCSSVAGRCAGLTAELGHQRDNGVLIGPYRYRDGGSIRIGLVFNNV